jgi:hypothetical protein
MDCYALSNIKLHLVGSLFDHDTDLMHLDTQKLISVMEAIHALQDAVTNWGHLLVATGGALKPTKCFLSFDLLQMDG